jgi:hypothetical protein
MENPGVNIQSVLFESGNIIVNYENGTTEILPNDKTTYELFNKKWLVNNPPFISDIYKTHMRNIILACINTNPRCIADLEKFFSSPNEEAVNKFFTYMRNRDTILPTKKAQWNPV